MQLSSYDGRRADTSFEIFKFTVADPTLILKYVENERHYVNTSRVGDLGAGYAAYDDPSSKVKHALPGDGLQRRVLHGGIRWKDNKRGAREKGEG